MTRYLRNAARRLARARAFFATATITLTLGIAGTTTVFTVVNGVLVRPLPYPRSNRLVDLSHSIVVSGVAQVDQSDATYLVYRRDNRVFTEVGVYRTTAVNMAGLAGDRGAGAERMPAASMSAGVFSILGAAPVAGRSFSDDDSRPGAPRVVVISERLWRRSFGGDAGVIGKQLVVDGADRTVVGVAPASFHFPHFDTALWLPLEIDPAHTKSAAFDYRGIARLRDGVSIEAAAADLQRLLPQVPEAYPGRLTAKSIAQIQMRAVVRPLRDTVVGDAGRVLWVVLGAVGVLLLIACANVANLFLARAEGRQRELAVLRALGAGQANLLGEFLSEAAIISVLGAVLGLIGAAGLLRALQTIGAGSSIPRLTEVRIDAVAFALALGLAVLAALVVSAMPVLRSRSASLSEMLMAGGPWGAGRLRQRVRHALVVAQVSLVLILLTAAGLLGRSFARLRDVDPGFNAQGALAVRMTLPSASYATSPEVARGILRTVSAIAALPKVRATGVATKLPLDAESRQDSAVWVEEKLPAPGAIPNLHQIVFTTPGYFRAMGIPLMSGRVFDQPDPSGQPSAGVPEAIISEAFARRYWKNESPIGKRLRMFPGDPWHVIVGVAGSVRDEALEKPPAEVVYCPLATMSAARTPWTPRDVAVVIRTTGDPTTLAGEVRRVVHDIDPSLPLYRVIPTSDLLEEAAARTTFTLLALALAALMALSIGAVGIYGVISYLVSLRTREIGVRLALGSTPAGARWLITRQALVDATIGIAVGTAGSLVVTRVMRAVLFEVSPTDPTTLAGAGVLLVLTAFAASWVPARRAARLDPVRALRAE